MPDGLLDAARKAQPVKAAPPTARKGKPKPREAPAASRTMTRDALLVELDEETEAALSAMPTNVQDEADQMLLAPDLIERVLSDIETVGVVGEGELAATSYLIGTSRLLRKPLGGIVQGATCAGKTFVPLTVAGLFPPESVVIATDFTMNSLYYVDPSGLMHRWVVAGEQRRGEDDDHADARKALREMLETGALSKLVTVKPKGGGPMRADLLKRYGPIAFTESTTKVKLFDEDQNRCLLLGADESQEQTVRIVLAQARRAAGKMNDSAPFIARHHALQRLLCRVRVEVPFAETLARAIPTERQEARRAMPHVLSMIEAVALLYQRQRADGELHHGDVIRATIPDYAIARKLLIAPLGRALGGALPEAVARFGKRCADRFASEVFSSTDALQDEIKSGALGSKSKVNEYLRALEGAGVVACSEEARGNRPARWRVIASVPPGGALWLPTPDALGGGSA